ncbi:MAG: phosphatidylglycerophosphatase A [Lentimonas sp.]|jgi:phosphatidylglycerophosphatase A
MIKDKFFTAIATGFWVGKIPFAPGTFGSLLGVLIWVIINNNFSPSLISWFIIISFLTILGIKSADSYSNKTKKDDAKEIVIDEICGQLLTYFIVAIFIDVSINISFLLLGFILFRFFDITKPLLIGTLDKKVKGGLGVMADDILAGICAGTSLIAITIILAKVFS